MVLIPFLIGIIVMWSILYYNKHNYRITNNSVLCFTGGLGSGKTLTAVKQAIRHHNKMMDIYLIKKLFYTITGKKVDKMILQRPYIYSNIPINHKSYIELNRLHLTLNAHINEGSTVLIDEVGQFASQYDWNKETVKNEFQEFVRFFRHYVNGRLILTDQNSDNIAVGLRRRINIIYNLDDLKKILPIPYFTLVKINITPITVTEDLKTIANTDVNLLDKHYIFMLITKRFYESRCYRKRYDKVPYDNATGHIPNSLYTNNFIDLGDETKNVQAS
jgi:hypothetical protein